MFTTDIYLMSEMFARAACGEVLCCPHKTILVTQGSVKLLDWACTRTG